MNRVIKTKACAVAAILALAAAFSSAAFSQTGQEEPTVSYATRPVQDDVFYFFMPISWRNGSGAGNYGDFKGMTDSLPYLESLGITAVWMTPIYPSPAYHGYQYSNGGIVNPWFGEEADFRNFVHAAHQAGIKVFIDFVAYGINQSSLYYENAYNNLSSPYSTMFPWTNSAHTESNSAYSYTTWNGGAVNFAYWNMNNPLAANVETAWAEHWADQNYEAYTDAGVDGFRCDHVVDTYDAYGPNGLGYTTANFWTPFKAKLKALHPNFFMFGEQNDWSLYGNTFEPPFDGIFTKPLLYAVRSSISSGTDDDFQSTLASTIETDPAGTYLCVFGDHDEDRLMSDIGDTFPRGALAAALEMSQPYPPIIYNGDEIGMHGIKSSTYVGDASDIPDREPFKWNAVAGLPMSNYYIYNTAAYEGSFEKNNDGRSVQEQESVSGSLLNTYKRLIAIRKASPDLLSGAYEPIEANNDSCTAFVRRSGTSAVLVMANFTGTPQTFKVDLSGYTVPNNSETVTDLISGVEGTALTTANKAAYPVTLGAYGYVYLSMSLDTLPAFFPRTDGYLPAVQRPPLTLYQNQASSIGASAQLDEGRTLMYGNRLYLGYTGSIDPSGGNLLVVLFNTVTGGQSTLNMIGVSQSGIGQLNGTKLPTGFYANAMAVINVYNGTYYVDWYSLPTSGPAVHTYRGAATAGRMFDQIQGGANPGLLELGVQNNSIAAGTAYNGVNTGIELSLQLSDIPGTRRTGGTVSVIAFLVGSDGTVSNQFLPPLPRASGALGIAPNLSTLGLHESQTIATDLDSFSVAAGSVTTTTTGLVYVANAAPAGGLKVYLTASNAYFTVPAYVVVPAGGYGAAFTIKAASNAAGHSTVISAHSGQITLNQTVSDP